MNRSGSESPKGDGRWGQSDMAGNAYERVLDGSGFYPVGRNNCAQGFPAYQVRGGNFFSNGTTSQLGIPSDLRTASSQTSFIGPSMRGGVNQPSAQGFRCARTP